MTIDERLAMSQKVLDQMKEMYRDRQDSAGEPGDDPPAIFKLGEVVRLKSGGPAMTVAGTAFRNGAGFVRCQWFETDFPMGAANPRYGDAKIGEFLQDSLEPKG